jgi:hypothetical protein
MNVLTRDQLANRLRAKDSQAFFRHTRFYNWQHDFPLELRDKKPNGDSVIIVEFTLSDEERGEFVETTKSKLTGNLALKISLDRSNTATVTVYKKGPGAKVQSQKIHEIARFVARRVRFEHILAVRTAKSAEEIVEHLVAAEMSRVEQDPAYAEALKKIAELQQPVLDELANSISSTLQKFLPDISGVSLRIPQQGRYEALRRCDIYIDDGSNTLLQFKGDGVQSLAALGIMRHASESSAGGKQLILAVEEPESHLHPTAIHELRAVLADMSLHQQVVITTHNPLFVDRVAVSRNIIVQDKKARPARALEEIRDVLGVRAADNMRHADLVLVVEGDDDRIALTALLSYARPALREAFRDGVLAVEVLGGVGNLSYRLSGLRTALCLTYVFLDDDEPARRALDDAQVRGLASIKHTSMAKMLGRPDCELEDWYTPAVYQSALSAEFGIQLLAPKFRTNNKWSVRMAECQAQMARPWNESLAMQVKAVVARAVAASPETAIAPAAQLAFESFADALVSRLTDIATRRLVP